MSKSLDKDKFFVAGSGKAYLPSNKVKAILDYDANVTKQIHKKAELANVVGNLVGERQPRRTLIWMENNTYYVTDVSVDTINKRVNESGTKTISVGRGFYIPIDHIAGVFDYKSNYAAKLRQGTELLQTKFSFLRSVPEKVKRTFSSSSTDDSSGKKGVSRKHGCTILLTSGENISVVYSPETIIAKTTR